MFVGSNYPNRDPLGRASGHPRHANQFPTPTSLDGTRKQAEQRTRTQSRNPEGPISGAHEGQAQPRDGEPLGG